MAEVLVTLTILGIVATIVVPNLMQQYKKAQTISRLKMAYSLVDNLTSRSYLENGIIQTDYQYVTPEEFHQYYGKYLNISKDCGASTYKIEGVDTGCFSSGTYRDFGTNEFIKDENGENKERDMFYDLDGNDVSQGGYAPSFYYKVLLKNGMGLGYTPSYTSSYGHNFVVDIDGPNKGESRLGQDVFQFTYFPSGTVPNCENLNLIFGAVYRGNIDKTCNVSRQNYLNRCSKTPQLDINGTVNSAMPNGSGCAGLIIKDGWKISKDYPWDYAQKKIKK